LIDRDNKTLRQVPPLELLHVFCQYVLLKIWLRFWNVTNNYIQLAPIMFMLRVLWET